jgi:RNA polymerase sigma-70 factor, ECF subfamily
VTGPTPGDKRRARFDLLYRSTRDDVLAYLLRRAPQPADAADLLAEVYLVAWRRLDAIPADRQARLWLYGVARRVLANSRRQEQTARATTHRLRDELRASVTGLAHPVAMMAVHDALDALDPDQRELLTLTAWEGLTPTEIASMTDQTAGAIRVRLHRARGQLRMRLTRLGIEPDDEPARLLTAEPGGL